MVAKIEKPVYSDRNGGFHNTIMSACKADARMIFEQAFSAGGGTEPWVLDKLAHEWVVIRQQLDALYFEMQKANGATMPAEPTNLIAEAFHLGMGYAGSEKPEDISEYLSKWLDERNSKI